MSSRTYSNNNAQSPSRDNNNTNNNNNNNTNNNFSLTYDQRILIRMYQTFYDNINRQIDELFRTQNEIREYINYIIRNPNSDNSANTHNSNTYNSNSYNANENSQRVFIDGRPYILEYQHHFIPNRRWSSNDISYNNYYNNNNNNNNSYYNDLSNNIFNPNIFTQFSGLDFLQNFYSNVPVIPTIQQVNDATLVCSFSQITNPINTSCPISLERFEENTLVTQLRGCGHIFTTNNIQSWFNNHCRCPVCRYDIRDYIPVNTNSANNGNFEAHENTINNSEQTERNSFSHNNSGSQNNNEERNSNLNNPIRNLTSNLSGLLVSQLISSLTGNRVNINNPNYRYDSSNNEILLEAFIDNVE
jgi:hypothetical protein